MKNVQEDSDHHCKHISEVIQGMDLDNLHLYSVQSRAARDGIAEKAITVHDKKALPPEQAETTDGR